MIVIYTCIYSIYYIISRYYGRVYMDILQEIATLILLAIWLYYFFTHCKHSLSLSLSLHISVTCINCHWSIRVGQFTSLYLTKPINLYTQQLDTVQGIVTSAEPNLSCILKSTLTYTCILSCWCDVMQKIVCHIFVFANKCTRSRMTFGYMLI